MMCSNIACVASCCAGVSFGAAAPAGAAKAASANKDGGHQVTHEYSPRIFSCAKLRFRPRPSSGCAMALGQIFGALHLLEAADGALELEAAVA